MRRSIRGTAIGNFMEWYDFGVYGYLATTIARVFYPGAGAASLIGVFGTLAAAFALRPVGGLVFGPLGDRIGRKRVLVTTLILMTAGTTATGLLPGYRAIGVAAPILLIVTRMVQGFSAGGEYVGAMVYIGEQAPDNKRGMMAGFLPLSSQAGYVVAGALVTGLQNWLPDEAMLSWGWRIPLLLSAPLGLAALYLRLRLEESSAYQHHGAGPGDDDSALAQLRRTTRRWRPLALCIALVLTYNVTDYLLTGYLPTYLQTTARVPHPTGLLLIVLTLLVMMAAVVPVARLSDHIGVKPVLWLGCAMLVVLSVPAFALIGSAGSYPGAFLGVLLIGTMLLCLDATLPATLPALFLTEVRYGALAIGFNLSVSAFGGTTPLIAEALVSSTDNPLAPAYLLIAAGAIGALALVYTPEVAGRRLPGSGPAVESEARARELVEGREA
ncbi:MFS transporter [Mycolicibacter sinensis]|uniref:Putative proline/betaine transporter n=1 Tax=Mycolicibacter sinensis (strain JDM601) TaxID=875328 RepID=A0A1A2XW59_MYCSD|nr:MFS transporter [Mycolicibacter sinensis]OBH18393.1 MFS transporter [Mycolicibacter sinensis]OBI29383.1 MFS transporter [Mycolicibacter sinensis]